MKTKMKKCCIRFMLAAVLLFLAACGREERQRGIDGCVYEAELVPDTEDWGNNFKKNGNWLYYMRGFGSALYRTSLEEDGTPGGGKAETVKGGEGILDYTLDKEGNLYCYRVTAVQDKNRIRMKGGTLTRYGEDGSQDYQVSLDGREAEYESFSSVPGCLAAGGEERVFLLRGDVILVIDGMGRVACEIDISANRPERRGAGAEKLLEGGNGRVYYQVTHTASRVTYEIAGDDTAWRLQEMSGSEWGEKWQVTSKFFGSPEGMLYVGAGGNLEEYSPQEGKWRAVLNWSESSLWQSPQEVIRLKEDKILASYLRTSNTGEIQKEFYVLDKKRVEELSEKEELVLACIGNCSGELEDAVIQFNRSDSRYHITIRVFEGEDAITRLDTALVSSDPPDMLELKDLNVVKYAEKQALEDLSTWLESSSFLKREDFLEEVLEWYTFDGRLVGIPASFQCETLLGNASEVGSEPGWKVEDVIRLTERYPGRKLNGRSFYYNLDTIFWDYVMEHFIDLENGECSFDSEEFCSLMVWLAEHSGSGTDYYAFEAVEDPLIVEDIISDIRYYVSYILRYPNGMAAVGYPSLDGEYLYHAHAYGEVGITAKSRNKEGSWHFIEYYLSEAVKLAYQDRIPSRRDLLEGILEDVMTPVYENDNREAVLDEERNTVESPKWIIQRPGEEERRCSSVTREEADSFLDMIAHVDFSLTDSLKTEAVSIIAEEAESCFGGNKSVEEAAEIIQNRVSLLVKELM